MDKSIEFNRDSTEEALALYNYKKALIEEKKPGVVNYLRESKDGKYNIYSYILVQGGTKGGIKKKYETQIGPRVEGTQFSDANGHPINKDIFSAGEIVYLRVPKKKETNETKEQKGTPGKIEYLGNRKDKQNRNRKFYSYTFVQGGTTFGVSDKRNEQQPNERGIARDNFCDKNGNKLKKERFSKGETIYIKIPNTDIIDPTPEMSMNEILNLNETDLMKVLYDRLEHCDKNGYYVIINSKKLYSLLHKLDDKDDNIPFIDMYTGEGDHYVSIGIKVGNKISGIYFNAYSDDDIYKGNLKQDERGSLVPENF